tara:strand:- start:1017 stop:1256 length:240 start_codon:yes stop_codon:yes gene_type:complete
LKEIDYKDIEVGDVLKIILPEEFRTVCIAKKWEEDNLLSLVVIYDCVPSENYHPYQTGDVWSFAPKELKHLYSLKIYKI